MRAGWVVNVSRDEAHEVTRAGPAVAEYADGEIIFDVWFWCPKVSRWFVMSHSPDQSLRGQGVIYFHPSKVHELARVVAGMARGYT